MTVSSRILLRPCGWALAGVLLLCGATPARAQWVGPPEMDAELYQPRLMRRDVPLFADLLALDPSQQERFEALFRQYQEDFRAGVVAVRDRQRHLMPEMLQARAAREAERRMLAEQIRALSEEMQQRLEAAPDDEERDRIRQTVEAHLDALRQYVEQLEPTAAEAEQTRQAWRRILAARGQWRRRAGELYDHLISQTRALLTDEQLARWPTLERALRRSQTLGRGRLSGESIDLLALATRAGVEPGAALDDYERQLDALLRARNDALERWRIQSLETILDEDVPPDEALAERIVRRRVEIRLLNDRFAQSIARTLPEEPGAAFLERYRVRAYPRVYRSTHTGRLFKAALELPDLEPEVLAAVAALEETYQAELRAMNARLLTALQKAEPAQLQQELLGAAAGEGVSGRAAERLGEALEARRALGARFQGQLRGLLGPERFGSLPGAAPVPRR